jgi:hypothetical protein
VGSWLEHPAVQAGIVPFVVALVVALVLRRVGLAWLAPTAGYASAVALATGIAFVPLTAGRKVLLLALLAPVAGWLVDRADSRAVRAFACVAAGAASTWVFWTVFAQRAPLAAAGGGLGVAVFVAVLCALMLALRDDGPAAASAGLGLGLATGIGALLSASTGYFAAGVALAAGSGALLLVQFVSGAAIRPGATGALAIGVATALFAAGTLLLAELPWPALPLLLAVPAVGAVPLPARWSPRTRLVVRTVAAAGAAALPVLAAWVAARAVPS